MEDMRAKKILARWDELKNDRYVWERQWQDIKELVRPDTSDFSSHPQFRGPKDRAHIFDGTAQDAAEELAAGISSFLTNPADRWFTLEAQDMTNLRFERDALLWLEMNSDLIYSQYCLESANFNQAMDEAYLDLVAFGTLVTHQTWDPMAGHLRFRTFPLADCWIDEDSNGVVDTVFRRICMTKRQAEQKFGELPQKMSENKEQHKRFTIIHAVFPRTDRDKMKLTPSNKPFASMWVCEDTKELIRESGFDFMPYHVARWRKLADEVYGRSPAMKCLPDIKMLNRMEELQLKAGSRAVAPPLMVPDDGFLLPIRLEPDSIIFKEPGAEKIETLRFEGHLPFGEEKTAQKREFIRKCFHNDWLRMEKQNVEMTAYEVQDRRDEKLRLLSPNLGRIQSELLGPMIALSYNYLERAGRIPPPPPILQGRKINPEYSSPASRAQVGIKVLEMDRYIQRLLPLAQAKPSVLDAIDEDAYAQDLAIYQGTPKRIVKDPRRIAQERAARQEQEQIMQMSQIAEPATKAIKNLAEARQLGGV